VFSDLSPKFAEHTISATAPSKTFNLAGLQHANIFIPNQAMREQFKREFTACGLSQPSLMGLVSCQAAYEQGEAWLEELLVYLADNMLLIQAFLQERIPKLKLVYPEGTYLAWIDCLDLNLPAKEIDEIILKKAKLWFNDGTKFGVGGVGFQRMNVACPRDVLQEALLRLEGAFEV
jgi:cystathionine beta-lyase